MFPLYCIHEACSKEGEEEHSNTDSSRTSSKKYLYLDWFSPDSAEWCLRLSSMKLRPAKQGLYFFLLFLRPVRRDDV